MGAKKEVQEGLGGQGGPGEPGPKQAPKTGVGLRRRKDVLSLTIKTPEAFGLGGLNGIGLNGNPFAGLGSPQPPREYLHPRLVCILVLKDFQRPELDDDPHQFM